MNVGLFVFGLFVTGIVAGACTLIVIGLREAQKDLEEREESKTKKKD